MKGGGKEGGFKSITDEILQTRIVKIQQNRTRRLQLPAHMPRKAHFLLIIDENCLKTSILSFELKAFQSLTIQSFWITTASSYEAAKYI